MLESAMSAIHREEIADGADGQRITRAIEYLTENFELQPSLREAAQVALRSRSACLSRRSLTPLSLLAAGHSSPWLLTSTPCARRRRRSSASWELQLR